MRPGPLRQSLTEPIVPPRDNHSAAGWPTLLVVDDDPGMLQALAWFFEKRGFHVAAAGTLAEARIFFQRHRSFALIVSDYHLPDGTGAEFCWWVRDQLNDAPPFLLMSGSMTATVTCPENVDFLAKPFTLEALEVRVRGLIATR